MTSRQAQLDEALARIADAIDPCSSVGIPQQLRGALEFGIASGELPIGARLPSVRALARQLNLSPVTVSNVYAALQSAGHVEGRVGSGTFVSPNAQVADPEKFHTLERAITNLIALARDCGIDRADLATRIGMDRPRNTRAVRVLMLGNFAEATRAYAADVRPHLAPGDSIEPMLIDEVAGAPPQDFDIVLSPRTLLPQARALFPQAEVVGLTVIPNEATRVALAAIPPEASVVGYSYFPTYVSMMKANVMRYAPHVSRLSMVVRGDESEAARTQIAEADVLIYATGADYLAARLAPGQSAFEYRHTPDSQELRSILPQLLDRCRRRERPGAEG
ncbi:GntR family transcriptional regulator [Alloyangia pacifica]|uniref:GntR family transcriptional regulator n=1 Tax=Alloyangia pacifica TaxID=311180 RepID=A0A2U8HBD5_9RHOB|nr:MULTISPECIES: GntR family transcriptional regulator [Roseobacteraceae]AWI83232.1 GntR family transcriptional regulator [Alloyangia pacifica]NDV49490.1 GntR family transcriptional regulator [Salipiger sp. PrR003]NDW34352.1 GntR family transcriptional regulator [Salipiger sp. PrR007]